MRISSPARCPAPALADRHSQSLAALSQMLGRSSGYLGAFVRESVPAMLTERDHHRLLAEHFGVSKRGLGIRDLWAGAASQQS